MKLIKETTKLKLRDLFKLILIIIVTLTLEYLILYFITQAEFFPNLQYLNHEYGNILMGFVSAIMAVATVIYAYSAYKQYRAEIFDRETKERPIIFPTILDTNGGIHEDYRNLGKYLKSSFSNESFPVVKQRLDIDLSLKNIGSSLADSVFVKASITYKSQGNNISIPLTRDAEYIGVLLPDDEEDITLFVYEEDIKKLLEILKGRFLLSTPFFKKKSEDLFYPNLEIDIIYKNMDGIYFCSKLMSSIYWIEDTEHPALSSEMLFENTIPPCDLKRDAHFKLRLQDSHHSSFGTFALSDRAVEKMKANIKDNYKLEGVVFSIKNPTVQNMIKHTVPLQDGEIEKILEISDRKKNM